MAGPRKGPRGLRYKAGKWYGRWTGADGRKRERALSTDRRVAERLLRKILTDADMERQGLGSQVRQEIRLGVLRGRYMAELTQTRRPAYVRSVGISLSLVLKELGDIAVKEVTSERVRAMRSRFQACGHSNRTCNMRVGALVTLLRWAEQLGEIGSNPLPRIPPLPTSLEHRKKVRRSLTAEEAARLLGATEAEDAKLARHRPDRIPQAPLLLGLIRTGLRSGEIRELRWAEVDFATRTLVVRAATAKNKKEERVDLSSDLVIALKALRRAQARSLGRVPSGWDHVFLTPQGRPWASGTNLLRLVYRLLARAGIRRVDDRGREIDVHALRVTCGSLLIQSGAELRVVQAHLRHSTPTLTASAYSDRRLVPVRRAIDAMPDLRRATEPGARDRSRDGGSSA